MTSDLAGHVFGLLLRQAAPLVLAPPGPFPSALPQLRGVVRTGSDRARVIFSVKPDADAARSVGFEFPLVGDRGELPVDLALDWLRTSVASRDLPQTIEKLGSTEDGHRNVIVDAQAAGFTPDAMTPRYDHNVFATLSILVHGGGFPWFEDVYTCAGFLITTSTRWRIYIRLTETGEVHGIDAPLVSSNGTVISGMGTTFPQVLASVLRTGTLASQPLVDATDEYSTNVYDMTSWIDPHTA